MSCVAIIPARGGSKRIPRKNIKAFLGKPIIAYGIEAALKSELFETVMVSTEDAEIAQIAKESGASYPFSRSLDTADDHATTVEVLLEVLDRYEQMGQSFEYGCCIYPTAPFVTAQKLQEAYDLLHKHSYDCVFPVLRFGFPFQRALRLDTTKRIELLQPEHISTRSQDLEPAFHDSGQFYFFKVSALRQKKQLWTNQTGAIVLSEMEAHDIDHEEDWAIAEFKYRITFHEST
jgi:pseudaminic acid cytidylyltransferase